MHYIDRPVKYFEYPLTPVPLSFGHVDGSLCKSAKSKLMHHLESKTPKTDTIQPQVTVADGMFMIEAYAKCLPSTFGQIARYILTKLACLSNRVVCVRHIQTLVY